MIKSKEDELDDETHIGLIRSISEISSELECMNQITDTMNSIAMNAAIEAARSETNSETFSNVSDQMIHQVEALDHLKRNLVTQMSSIEKGAITLIGAKIVDVTFHINCCLLRNFQAITEFCIAFTQRQAGKNLIKQIGVSSHTCPHLRSNLDSSSQSLSDEKKSIQGIFLMDDKGKIWIWSIQSPEINLMRPKVLTLPMNESGGYSSLITGSDNDVELCYLHSVRNTDQKFIGYLGFLINISSILEVVREQTTDIDGRALLFSNGHGKIALPSSHAKGDFSWIAAFDKVKGKKVGYTLESAKNGWLAIWGYYPIESKFLEKCELYLICWRYLRLTRSNISLEDFEENLIQDHSILHEKSIDFNKKVLHFKELLGEFVHLGEQINMLSVNAAIQATMAGREGKAFSIVANQIGNLSRQTDRMNQKVTTAMSGFEKKTKTISKQYIFFCLKCLHSELSVIFDQFNDLIDSIKKDITLYSKTDDIEYGEFDRSRLTSDNNMVREIELISEKNNSASSRKNHDAEELIESFQEVISQGCLCHWVRDSISQEVRSLIFFVLLPLNHHLQVIIKVKVNTEAINSTIQRLRDREKFMIDVEFIDDIHRSHSIKTEDFFQFKGIGFTKNISINISIVNQNNKSHGKENYQYKREAA